MAGGKLTPRQKMINMMYLVLTALLALNVSREVMDAFYDVMKNQEATISTVDRQNQAVYSAFAAAAAENPARAGKWKDEAYEVKAKAEELNVYLDSLKEKLVMITGGRDEETGKPKKMDNKEKVANYMIVEKHGTEVKQKLDDYRNFLIQKAGNNDDLIAAVNTMFNTDDHVNKDGVKEPWEKHMFEHYPLISVMTFLTSMQSDVKTAEAQTIDFLQENIGKTDLKFTGVKAIVMPKSNYVTQGDEYEAEVFLAAYDETQEPIIEINGEQLASENIANGRGLYKFKTSATGQQTWAGTIKLKQPGGKISTYTVADTFTVAPPSVVISPSKLNVLYRMVDNPLEIGVPGVDPKNIRVSGPGVRKVGNGWSADVTKVKGKTMNINVQVVDEKGNTTMSQSKEFRIKGLPQAEGLFFKRSGGGTFSKSAIKNGPIEAGYPDFPYDLKLTVTSFEVKIDGYPPAKVRGNKLDGTTKSRIDGLKPGASVTIRNIEAKTSRGDKVTKIGNISLDVN